MSIFSSSQDTHTSSENNSTGNTQGNLATNPQYQQFLQGYGANAVDAMGNITTPTNPWGEQAAGNQSNVVNNINPALTAASNAASGTTYNADSYKPFMSPYTQDVTNAIRDQFGTTMGQVAEQARGHLASQGALGNSNNPVAITNALTPVANAENAAIANVIQQGFNQANQNAQEAGRFQLQGANTLGSTIGAATGANSGLANIGQGLFGQQMQAQEFPATLGNLFTQGWQGNNSIAGYNTQSHSTGTSDSTTTKNPSVFSDILGTIGLVMGMPMGGGGGSMGGGGMANGGPVMQPYADGGAVIDLDPVLLAHLIKGMPPAYAGKFADGGDVQDERPVSLKESALRPYVSLLDDLQRNGPRSLPVDHGEIKPNTDWVLEKYGLPGARAADALETVGNFGKAMIDHPASNVADALEHPSLGKAAKAGASVLMTAGRPAAAAGTLLGGAAISGAQTLAPYVADALAPSSAQAAEPKKMNMNEELPNGYTRQQIRDMAPTIGIDELALSGMKRGQIQEALKAAADAKRAASVEAERDALRLKTEAAREQAKRESEDYNQKRAEAVAARDAEFAKEGSPFAKTPIGKYIDELGGYDVALGGAAMGLPAWAAARKLDLATGNRANYVLKDWVIPGVAGAFGGATMSLGPNFYNERNAPKDDPYQTGMRRYVEKLADNDPDKKRFASVLTEPTRPNQEWEKARDNLAFPGVLTTAGRGMLEGFGGGMFGGHLGEGTLALLKGLKSVPSGVASEIGGFLPAVAEAHQKGMGRVQLAKADAAAARQGAAESDQNATRAASDALAARADLEEALRRSNGPKVSTDQPASPLPQRSGASDRNSGQTSGAPAVGGNDTVPVIAPRQESIDELNSGIRGLREAIEAQRAKPVEIAPAPVVREALPNPRSPSYTNKYKGVAQPFITGRVNEGRDVPTTAEVMGQFDKANMKQPSFKTVDERVGNADRLLALIQSKNPGITPQQAARKLGDYMANPKSIPSDWGLPKEFILPSVAAPIAASGISGNDREGHADGGYVSPETHEIPEGHAWEHRGVGSKVRGPDGAFVSMGIAQRKNGGRAAPKRAFSTGGAVTIGPVMGVTGGRTDAKPVNVPANSYVIPADVVSGLPQAEGNTTAGMHILQKHFGAPMKAAHGYASGGTPHKPVPILISDGEFVVTPDMVAKHGGGDVKQGHRVLDALVKKVRAANIKKLKSLPAPAR